MNNNLQNQFNRLIRLDHTGSFQTKKSYHQAMGQFLTCCSDQFKAQNIKNLGDKHIRYFVEDQLDNGVSQRTLQKQVAGIKHFLLLANAKFSITNHQLGIAGRTYQALQGTTPTEYRRALALCTEKGKGFEEMAIKSMYTLGLRSNEVVNLRYGSLRDAIKTGILIIQDGTKGGRKRSFALTADQMTVVKGLEASHINPDGRTNSDKVFCSRQQYAVQQQKSRLHNFFTNYGKRVSDTERTDALSCHSFRRAFAQGTYDRCRLRGLSKENTMRYVKMVLGHSPKRGLDVTAVYVKNKW